MYRSNYAILFLSILVIVSCISSRNQDIEQGSNYNFKAGYPEFHTSAFGYIDEQNGPTLSIRTEIVKSSLSFKKQKDSLVARVALDLQIQNIDDPENIIDNKRFEKVIAISKDSTITSSRETLKIEYSIPINYNRYKIFVTVEDQNTNKNLTQETEAAIPKTKSGEYSLSDIQLFGKEEGQNLWRPIATYDVQSDLDSLRFVFQVISARSEEEMILNSKLVRYHSDTSFAQPMDHSNYRSSSIKYKGIDYDQETEIQSNQRILTDYSSVFIEYKFENEERGNYRFIATAQKGENSNEIFKARSFGIKSSSYPAIKSARELAQPLAYLMKKDEYEELMEISNSDSLKKQVDRFWLKNIGNLNKAKQVIELYYERVEQANKQFSNFKEGWKTDMGMIYILFGSPFYIDDHLKEMNWFYSYNRTDTDHSYVFEQPKIKNRFYPFYHYILERRGSYHTVEYMQKQLWWSGQILTRRI